MCIRDSGYSTKIFEKVLADLFGNNFTILNPNEKMAEIFDGMKKTNGIKPVSYTHLTLPTSDLV